MEQKTFQVPNIGCDGCVNTIKSELTGIAGVQSVSGETDTKTITVQWAAPATWLQITDVLTQIEYAPAN
ncbi:MAG: heavy-metal-associated domain-containing protein [Armatimonadetes bacterium]|nr:heavy-metal-associated domain-containing protein [Anaerolineae bacterium]